MLNPHLPLAVILLITAGCSAQRHVESPIPNVPEPLRAANADVAEATIVLDDTGSLPGSLRVTPGPPAIILQERSLGPVDSSAIALEGEAITLNLDGVSLAEFINEVYGNLLGLSFVLDAGLKSRRDLVSLRISDPTPPQDLFETAGDVLTQYGVVIDQRDGLLTFRYAPQGATGKPPLLVSGIALPSVPVSHRPVFRLIPLRVVRNVNVAQWLRKVFQGRDMTIAEDAPRNSILLQGSPAEVAAAVDVIDTLDRPFMVGKHSVILEPSLAKAKLLAESLQQLLEAQGIGVARQGTGGAVILLPLEYANAVLAFASDRATLGLIEAWAERLDRLGNAAQGPGVFWYPLQHTAASSLVGVVRELLPELAASTSPTARTNADGAPSHQGSRLVVDEARNAILFAGKAEDWERLVPVFRQMDRPLKQVLIEVVVAEVTLNDQQQLGIEWLVDSVGLSGFEGSLQTNGLGVGAAGLSWFPLSNSGSSRLILNAFAEDKRISLLSTPRVTVRSGETATINVGSEVPVVTTQSTAPDIDTGNSPSILQNIQYRKTGIILTVKPVVHSGRRIDLEISQEVSEAQPNTTSDVGSPVILNRSLQTSLSLEDGGSVLLGGLISENEQKTSAGVPVLKDLPGLGQLFRVDGAQADRTELLMLVVPYVLGGQEEAESITRAFRQRLAD